MKADASLVPTIERLWQRVDWLERELVRVRHEATHDNLTGLPNRGLIADRLSQALEMAQRQRKLVGLMLVDLDGFKSVNDTLGHAAGDLLLRAVATRLVLAVRGADTVGRYGGDEFLILLPEVTGAAGLAELAKKLSHLMSKAYEILGHSVTVTGSIGVALYPADGSTLEELVGHADSRMFLCKARQRATLPGSVTSRSQASVVALN